MKKDTAPTELHSLDDLVLLSRIRGGTGFDKLEGAVVTMKIKQKKQGE